MIDKSSVDTNVLIYFFGPENDSILIANPLVGA
jgi:hypothetical protein